MTGRRELAIVLAGAAAVTACAGPPPGAAAHRRMSPAASPARPPRSAPAATPSATPTVTAPLAGRVVGIDPGHNGGNGADPAAISRLIWNGRELETCDTTGTETGSGYTEATYNFSVATYLRADLRSLGAQVVMTRHSNTGVGPCVTRRARILDDAHASVAIDIHADGGPAWGRGFTVLEPVADGPNDQVIASSDRFGDDVRAAVLSGTPMPESDYDGSHGRQARDDLAGLNLTTVPKVLLECGNMRNATDAALLSSARFQRLVARALTSAIVTFLTSG